MDASLFSPELRRRLLAFIRRRVNSPDDAEDVLQSVLLKMHNAGNLREDEAVRGWMFQVARNAVIDYYRGKRPHDPLPDHWEETDLGQGDAESQALLACMRQMIDELPETYREALVLSDVEGIPQKDVAERLGVGVSGAKSRIQRGREKLKELVQTCCHLELDTYGNPVEQICQNPHCNCCH